MMERRPLGQNYLLFSCGADFGLDRVKLVLLKPLFALLLGLRSAEQHHQLIHIDDIVQYDLCLKKKLSIMDNEWRETIA